MDPGLFTLGGATGDISFEKLLVLAFLFVTVVVGVIAMTKAQRRIPTQSAKHVRGRRVWGGQRQYLPLQHRRLPHCEPLFSEPTAEQ